MMRQRTVIILGAGASAPYGFPCGDKLLMSIHASLGNSGCIKKLIECGIDRARVQDFRDRLAGAQPLSIDNFLEHRREFIDVGRLAIAWAIFPLEREDHLTSLGRRENAGWYHYLLGQMNDPVERFSDNRLSVVTLNYERALEQWLFVSLRNRYNLTDDDCFDLMKTIPIIHLHGSFGPLPWQPFAKDPLPYGAWSQPGGATAELLRKAASGIQVISQQDETLANYDRAHDLLQDAKRIYFLGFGYHSSVLSRLHIEVYQRTPLVGTSYGMELAEVQRVNSAWHIQMPDTDRNCEVLAFLRRYAPLE